MAIILTTYKGRVIYYQVGGRLYSVGGGGVGIFFGDVLGGGVKIKIPWGRGGSYISSGIWEGVRCVPLVFAFIKSFWGAKPPPPPRPPISQMILPTISNIQNKNRLQNKLMYCGVTMMYPKTLAFYFFIVRFR